MDIFLSWSGDQSKAIAEKFKSFLSKTIQQANPYISSQNIDLGSIWSRSLMKEATQRKFGLIFITSENKSSPWIHYEAGCLMKDLDEDRVVPILFGIKKGDVKGPLSLLQMIEFDKDSVVDLLKQINQGTANPIGLDNFTEIFETFFPKAFEEIQDLMSKGNNTKSERDPQDLLYEMLGNTREIKKMVIEMFMNHNSYESNNSRNYVANLKVQELFKLLEENCSENEMNDFMASIADIALRNEMRKIIKNYKN